MAPTSSDNPGPLVAKPQLQGTDADDGLFSALFSAKAPEIPSVSRTSKSRHVRRITADSDSEFGAFVSVPAMKDPLTALDFDSPALTSSQPFEELPATGNSTLTFFDKFAQDARDSLDRKQGILDELLNHEDEPLYWVKNGDPPSTSQKFDFLDDAQDPGQNVNAEAEHSTPHPNVHDPHDATKAQPMKNIDDLLDLDHDFFTSKTPVPPDPRPHITHHPPDHSPSRTSTLALPIVPAPPLADTHNASFTASHPNDNHDPFGKSYHHRSSSYSTLTNLSSKWMSSLLSSSSKTPARPSLESVFTTEPDVNKSSEHPPNPLTLHRTYTHPTPPVSITHNTPFGRTVKASPFASHSYIPPSGAPGYRGEQYDWDKGFSADLDREMDVEVKERELVGVHGKVVAPDVGLLIEKKTGGVHLTGRRASTTPILEESLADLIRSHLPALARLPKKWMLIYSLDQHGISLNTLYDRCEAHMQVKPGTASPAGALVVVKDEGNGIFGVWMGKEGVHPSRGKGYYGSGDSFLWKYLGGKLKVFKWTGRNDYVALCEPQYISFGGGDGNYGLYLDDTLFQGSSAACPTFANEPLCSTGANNAGVVAFECVGLEVWGIGP
ncbi:hypothetical protein H0H92_013325 [Tricholoma furcatifolium]|nr:hypothetical protein H0H92_013325 [Tricholoma furcatifolium]